MLINRSIDYRKYYNWQILLKWIEVFFLCALLIIIFWYFYTSNCHVDACNEIDISYDFFQLFVAIILPIVSVIGSLRVACVFMLIDPDEQDERWFYISLGGIALAYSIFGMFYDYFLVRATLNSGDNWPLLAMLTVLVFTVGALLREKQTWDKANFFVRFRIGFCLTNLILLIINPIIGLILMIIFAPVLVLITEGQMLKPESQELNSDFVNNDQKERQIEDQIQNDFINEVEN